MRYLCLVLNIHIHHPILEGRFTKPPIEWSFFLPTCSRILFKATNRVAGKGAIHSSSSSLSPWLLLASISMCISIEIPRNVVYHSREQIPGLPPSLFSLSPSPLSPTHSWVWEDLLSAASDRTQCRSPRHVHSSLWSQDICGGNN